ncbi:MAG TPA: zf-HC2 domain-containing protein [Acidimicrobiales bacterium]|nr:zf-HC2 domain-containing protein [Acidimicrobiales bacterium]
MRCQTARSLVSDYIDGELDASTAAEVEAHLADCASCPPLAAALQAVLGQLRALPEVPAELSALERALADVNPPSGRPQQGESSWPS